MIFEDVITDIESLTGMNIESISRTANLTVEGFDKDRTSLLLVNSDGRKTRRSIAELEKIWKALQSNLAVHVDSVLDGSGSSRNQPETVFANLPYIEYLKLEGKKHIAFVGKKTHDLGTLKPMDSMKVQDLKLRITEAQRSSQLQAVIVVEDIALTTKIISGQSGINFSSISPGLYIHQNRGHDILIISRALLPPDVSEGTYLVMPSFSRECDGVNIRLNSYKLCFKVISNLKVVIVEY